MTVENICTVVLSVLHIFVKNNKNNNKSAITIK